MVGGEQSTVASMEQVDPDIARWEGYKKLYDIFAGAAKERWQCGYNVLQMLLKAYAGVSVPLYTLQLYLRRKARAFKEREGEIANLTPEDGLRFGEFTQLEDMAAYVFDIKPFSDEFNDCMYYPHLMSVAVGGTREMTVEELFANEAGKYCDGSQDCKDARQTHLACAMEKAKYQAYTVDGREYTGAQLFAKDWEGKGYVLKGANFDKVRSRIAVEDAAAQKIRVGGHVTTISNLFGYEYDKKMYEQDRRFYGEVFYVKVKNYFAHVGHRAGIPVVFNAMIYLIVDVTMDPEPSFYLLDPHDMAFVGDKFKDKKKRVPLHYILGSPTGATLFFPPKDEAAAARIKQELEDPALLQDARERFSHLLELALFNKDAYLREVIHKNAGKPMPELAEFFSTLGGFGQCVFDNAVVDELRAVFGIAGDDLGEIKSFFENLTFSYDLLAGELAHHQHEKTISGHKDALVELFRIKNVFISLPAFIKNASENGIPGKEEMLWYSCIKAGEAINMNRIASGTGAAARVPLTKEEIAYYAYIFKGLLYLFNSQDRYSHVENVEEFLGNDAVMEVFYILAAIGEGMGKGSPLRNAAWMAIVEDALNDLAERIHKVLHGSVLLDSSIDRFLKQLEQGKSKIDEQFIEDMAREYSKTCTLLILPLDGVLWMVDQLKNRMKQTNIIKRQILVAISLNMSTHPDIKARVAQHVDVKPPAWQYTFHAARETMIRHGKAIREIVAAAAMPFSRDVAFQIADGSILKEPAMLPHFPTLVKIIDAMRVDTASDMNGLQEVIQACIGTIAMVDKIDAIRQFNALFKLEGSRETDFAAKVNSTYQDLFEKLDFDEVIENTSPLLLK